MDGPAAMLQEEAAALFNHVGKHLSGLDKQPASPQLYESVQQGFHSIKVLCSLMALSQAAHLAGRVDEVFSSIRKGELQLTAEIANITTASYDQLKEEIEAELENTPIDSTTTETLLADWERLAPHAMGTGQAPSFSRGKLRILVIDDELVSRNLLANLITRSHGDAEVVSVASAEEGLYYYLTSEFDLVFLDIIMPIIDGNDFIAIVEKNHELGHLRDCRNIVVQTGIESMEQLLSYIKKSCVQEVIRKPISPQRIADCLERYSQSR